MDIGYNGNVLKNAKPVTDLVIDEALDHRDREKQGSKGVSGFRSGRAPT